MTWTQSDEAKPRTRRRAACAPGRHRYRSRQDWTGPQYGHGLVDAAAAVGLSAGDPDAGGGDGGDTTAPLALNATGTKVNGEKQVELTWTDASDPRPAEVDIYRDGSKVATVANEGAYSESLGKGGGSHTYVVCHPGVAPLTCSNEVTVGF